MIIPSSISTICLFEGLHNLEIHYLGQEDFKFSWSVQSEWMTKQAVPDSMLYYVNTSPTDITITSDSIEEKMPVNTVIGDFITTDAEGGPFTYKIKGTLDYSSFAIKNNALLSNESFIYDVKNEYQIIVASSDDAGFSLDKKFLIKIREKDSVPSSLVNINQPGEKAHWPDHPEQWVNIYPVPVNEQDLTIQYYKPENGKVKIKIQTVEGKVFKTYSFKKSQSVFSESINFSGYPEGLYMLEIHQGGQVFKQVVIK
jgi:hypothetical protein